MTYDPQNNNNNNMIIGYTNAKFLAAFTKDGLVIGKELLLSTLLVSFYYRTY